ncbi:hypothetical protein BZA70DRAFT_279684 [Myxozyma melibiosi]|uniref:DNA-directed RNA polymerase n=1 Tax=Myxozyma melibiosi TaxID=54550 RepID=A0ABR1F6C6_9ASCO
MLLAVARRPGCRARASTAHALALATAEARRTFIAKPSNNSSFAPSAEAVNPSASIYDVFTKNDDMPISNIGNRPGKLVMMNEKIQTDFPDMTLAMRNKFTKNRAHLISLIDALVAGQNFARARKVLIEAYEVTSREEFARLLNDYLQEYALKELKDTGAIEQTISYLLHITDDFKNKPLDPRSYAILMATACRMEDIIRGDNSIKKLFKPFSGQTLSGYEILQHQNLFSYSDARRIIDICKIPESDVPPVFRFDAPPSTMDVTSELDPNSDEPLTLALIKAQAEAMKEAFDGIPASVPKAGYEELNPVDSIGLKYLRSSLKGVAQVTRPVLPIYNAAEASGTTDEGFLNFEAQIEKLPEEEQDQYREAFEVYNNQRQRLLEALALESAKERWKHDYEQMISRGDVSVSNINEYLWEWHQAMAAQVEYELYSVDRALEKEASTPHTRFSAAEKMRLRYGPYIKLLNVDKLCTITILELIRMHATIDANEGLRTARAVLTVGRAIQQEYNSEQLLRHEVSGLGVFKPTKSTLQNPLDFGRALATAKRLNEEHQVLKSWRPEWPEDVKAEIGSTMISIFMHVAKLSVKATDPVTGREVRSLVPAMNHSYQYNNGMKLGVIKLHKDFSDKISSDRGNGMIHPQFLPMLVKPKPWTSHIDGGYMYSSAPLMRTKSSMEQSEYVKEAAKRNDMKFVFEGLNVLGSASWVINSRVFRIVAQVWNTEEEFLDIPGKISEKIEFPPEPEKSADPAERRDWARKCKLMVHNARNSHSQRCDINYKLEIARAFIGERIYFPHNIDFRGRAYAIPPHLNHLGNDMCRGIMMFWEAKPLGERGLRWLKIHYANLSGYDKADFEERVKYAEEHIEDIFDSADHPLDGRRVWMKAAKPWQNLAVCFELAEALRMDDPTQFRSRLPIHQDGTCNGLQHYAALGGDSEGAAQVNLMPSDRPADIYTYVSNKVSEIVEHDAKNGVLVAQVVRGKVSRKVVKQSVMTNVYGVTYIGARAQIASQLKQLPDLHEGSVFGAASYLTKLVFQVVRDLFHGAHLIQDWFAECAKRIAKSYPPGTIEEDSTQATTAVVWTTPLGIPVVQPYRVPFRKQVSTNLQTVYISEPLETYPVNWRKQTMAFPPNYIHSLDATHMLLSAVVCGRKGLTFAAVHDSYWTHACDVDTMNTALRESFIKLHKADLISRLKAEFEERYKGYTYQIDIDRFSEQGQAIVAWRKAYRSKHGHTISLMGEVKLETKRTKLLESENPEEVKKGQEMVTPLSIIGDADIDSLRPPRRAKKQFDERIGRSSENETHGASDAIIRKALGVTSPEAEESATEDEIAAAKLAADSPKISISELGANLGSSYMEGIKIMVPLSFPPVPPKGDFDVERVRESLYFFS